jgi:phosphoglucosamine mutase
LSRARWRSPCSPVSFPPAARRGCIRWRPCDTGDGLVTALQILAVVAQSGKPVSEICNRFEPLPQILKNVRYKNGQVQPLDNLAVRKAIDSGKSRLGTSGRLVIRPSGTEPVIRVMAEGDDVQLVDTVVSDIVHALTDAAA